VEFCKKGLAMCQRDELMHIIIGDRMDRKRGRGHKRQQMMMTPWKRSIKTPQKQPRTGRDGSGEENNRCIIQNVKNLQA